jgi:hypothetical protein
MMDQKCKSMLWFEITTRRVKGLMMVMEMVMTMKINAIASKIRVAVEMDALLQVPPSISLRR